MISTGIFINSKERQGITHAEDKQILSILITNCLDDKQSKRCAETKQLQMAQVKYTKVPQSEEDADSETVDLQLESEPQQIETVDRHESVNIVESSDESLIQEESEKQRKENLRLKAITLTEKKLLLRLLQILYLREFSLQNIL